ncbi:fibronectin-like [Takifugu rubripes]|uniref:fibronectin-like n=1 Tax=Takifugu rubripes TaxID=31033 RepID=UPI0011460E4A|nr:fibronectin-like [Takifugu rubripes]
MIGSNLPPSMHTTTNTSYTLTNLTCGRRYAFRIAVQDGQSHSSYGPATEISTAPCQPSNLTARIDCGANNANFSWAETSNASFYTVEVTGEHGHVASCSSNTTSCFVKLHCGRSYSASLVASTESCNSSKHADILFDSAPCLPDDITAEIQCNTNGMNVSWAQTPGSDNYTAWAISTDGRRMSCNSTSNSCSIHNLQCGQIYEVAVTSSSMGCDIIAGSDYKVHSAPCKPENTSVEQNCSSNVMTVKWNRSNTTQNYTVKATSATGVNSTCESSLSRCTFLNLTCGQRYTFTVVAHSNVCMSEMSNPIETLTAPCPPTNVSAKHNCTTRKALVLWGNTAASTGYSVLAISNSGQNSSCSNMGTSCQLSDLVCGQQYSVVVEAMTSGCPGPTSAPVTLTTEPCTPMNLSVHYNVSTAQVTWNAAQGARSYSAQAVADQGSTVLCNTTNKGCFLNGLQCGQVYNVSVTAHERTCDSETSPARRITTEPCPPTNVRAVLECEQHSATVSWQQSHLATGYVAYFENQSGHDTLCTGTQADTQCVVSGLVCDTVYSVWVKALGQQYNSSDSTIITLTAGPCMVSRIGAVIDCEADSALISWQPSSGAVSYITELTAASGHVTSCATNHTNCELSSMQCGEEYNVTVKAVGGTCNSTAQMAGYLSTEPCAPRNLSVSYNVSTAMVMWGAARGASSYSVQAVTHQGLTATCNTSQTDCFINGLQCGQIYNVTVTAHNQACNNTVVSERYRLLTEPCPPTAVQATMDCEQLNSTVSWQRSDLAVGYVAYFENQNGHCVSCVAGDTDVSCHVSELMCGTVYRVRVKALGQQYNSSDSTAFSLTSAPCQPPGITGRLDCVTNSAWISWDAAAGADSYFVTAVGAEGSRANCSTSSNTTCEVEDLACGVLYNFSVVAKNSNCESQSSETITLETAPCSLSGVTAVSQCHNSTILVLWDVMEGGEGNTVYSATAEARDRTYLSCNITGTSCYLYGAQCDSRYSIIVSALSDQCSNLRSPPYRISMEPCPPTNVAAHTSCEEDSALVSWSPSPVAETYHVVAVGEDGHNRTCNSTSTNCTLSQLLCEQKYTVFVTASHENCTSQASNNLTITTAPCAPRNVSASQVCLNRSVLVSWVGSPSALWYNVTMIGQDGLKHHCQTNSSTCEIPNIHCGGNYNITVVPHSETCAGQQSDIYEFRTGLCAPDNITVSPAGQDIVVSWSPVTGAETFAAIATANDGHNYTCNSTSSNSCNLTDLPCGENYTITVVTVDGGCWSEPSSAVVLRTASCQATNLTAHLSCDTNTLTLTWAQSQLQGTTYILQTEMIGSNLPPSMHTTTNTSYTLTNLTCGRRYAFRIAVQDGQSHSSYGPATEISTAPCQPSNLTARIDCGANNANFSWAETSNASFYTVEVTGEHGHVASCSSNTTSCFVKLHCGRSYSASLVASTESCNSSKHADILFDSAPCLPDDITAEIQCNTNGMNVSWAQTPGSDNYTAWAISTDGRRMSCNSTSNSCSIHNLQCGQIYEVAVTSSSMGCDIIAGSDYKVHSAPCKPENTSVEQNCSSNVMTVKWNRSNTTQNYTVKATSATGVNSTCESSLSRCTFLNLTCGQLYTFTVVAHSNVCMSEMSNPIETLTAPCPPTNVSAKHNCTTRKALVCWGNTAASTGYSVLAISNSGQNSSCSNMGTSCQLSDLVCGQQYSVVVEAMTSGCPGPTSAPVTLTTEPCTPMNLSVHYNVSTAQVTWNAAQGARSYSAQAVADQGSTVLCNTTNKGCFLNGLQCGQVYNVSVTAHERTCDSETSPARRITTEPCPPTNVRAVLECEQHSATVSWQQSNLATGYVAYFENQSGHDTLCTGTQADTQCVVSGLVCDTVYSVRVKALGQQYNSSDSTIITLTAGPCMVSRIGAVIDCEADSALISWQPSSGAVSYITELTAASGHVTSCATNHTNCELSSMQCGEEYNVTVKAVGGTCNSTAQMAGYLSTEPCAPGNLSVSYNVSIAMVMWGAARGASSYSVQAIYNVTVTAHNQACNNTVVSERYRLLTEPCPPTAVQATMDCEQLNSTVSWQRSDLAVGYVAYFENQNGHCVSCVAGDTDVSCHVSELMCGTVYRVRVKALGQQYNSSDSTAFSLTSELHVDVECSSDVAAVVSWNATYGTANFSLTAIISGTVQTLCTTQHNACNVTGLSCGETYNLSLTASNDQCSFAAPTHANLTARPCPPQRVAIDLQCGSRTAVLSWEERADVELYRGRAVKTSGSEVHNCTSTGSTCQFSSLDCGETYNFTVTAYSQGCSSQASSTLLASPMMSLPMFNVRLIRAPSAGDSATVPNLTLLWQRVLMDIGTSVSQTPPPALGATYTVEKNTLLW